VTRRSSTHLGEHCHETPSHSQTSAAHSEQPLSGAQSIKQPTGAASTQPSTLHALLQHPGWLASQPSAQLCPA
jgi:hypothetical protein